MRSSRRDISEALVTMGVAIQPESRGTVRGPAGFFLDHPLLYALSLAGAGGAATYALYRASVADRPSQRLAMAALGTQCAAEFIGILIATEVARAQFRSAA